MSFVRKRAWFRIVMAVWGVWFTAALTEAAGLHTCAMHGSHSAHAAVAAHAGTHAGHQAPHQQVAKDCTCLGLCCGASIMAPRVSVEPSRVSVYHDDAASTPGTLAPRVIRAYALPFANGPPVAV